MARPLWTTDEIGRACERIERRVGDLDEKVDQQGVQLADLSTRMAVFEATRPSALKPIAAAGASMAGGGGILYALIEVVKHIWK